MYGSWTLSRTAGWLAVIFTLVHIYLSMRG